MLRDFKKHAGMSAERWLESLDQFERNLGGSKKEGKNVDIPPLEQLSGFYAHFADLAAGYEKDPQKRSEHVRIIQGWKDEVDALLALLT
jgi:hypothetical protein